MKEAIRLSIENVKEGGGPFAAIIVKDGKVIASGVNRVTADNDPTAHAEIVAIRNAAKALNSFDLSGCEIFSTCEPCPMCLGAIYWAHLSSLIYANSSTDAEKFGFDDSLIYKEIQLAVQDRKLPSEKMPGGEALEAFLIWDRKPDKEKY